MARHQQFSRLLGIMVPVVTAVLHLQMKISTSGTRPAYFPPQSLRIYTASILAAFADLIFLAMAWEFLGKPRLKMPLWLRDDLAVPLDLESSYRQACASLGIPT